VDSLPSDTGVILVDHGSVAAEANAMLFNVVAMFREVSGAAIVEPAHMELAPPTIGEAFGKCLAQGAARVVIHPYFLAPGRHGSGGILRRAAEAAEKFPGTPFAVSEPLGADRRIGEVIQERVLAAMDRSSSWGRS
jgi:sirohydrochlorin ferrochelatase